jgi:chorismate mutase
MPKDKSNKRLETLREELRGIDDEIIRLVVKRMDIARDIGARKRATGAAILDAEREAFNRKHSKDIAAGALSGTMVDELTDLLAKWARDIQEKAK